MASGVPDLDTVRSLFGRPLTPIHRGPTHSIPGLVGLALVAAAVWRFGFGGFEPGLWIPWTAALLVHPFLDTVTTGPEVAARGFGVALFWPFWSKRWSVSKPLFNPPELRDLLRSDFKAMVPEVLHVGLPTLVVLVVTSLH